MRKKTNRGIAAGSALIFSVLLSLPGFVAASRTSAAAEVQTKVPVLRTVEGDVRDKRGAPVKGAVVYLKNDKTLAVKSYLSDEQGQFHFRHLSMNEDYELWAEQNGKRSSTKNISQFNSKPDVEYSLKLPR